MTRTSQVILGALLSTSAVAAGAAALGPLAVLVFAVGYFGGFALWLCAPNRAPYARIRAPHWLTMVAFLLLHKVEENQMGFFDELARLSGRTVPEATSPAVIAMLAIGFVPWLLTLPLLRRQHPFGYYFAWTFFASIGLSELAHFFLFPFRVEGPYRYFPGMWSVLVLAPLAWVGIWRLWHRDDRLALRHTTNNDDRPGDAPWNGG